ncbi:sugar ABC transporter ATP-binding protein [Burkholderia gladioli]|uniref:sugar ABC transporter ATP-binding protein n=1 Tax=Burkholderia gladioli TaxID=28095 RepID=UPI000BF02850|nr:sugar ABC transporter ATP-binding protein [Burkholderia gladioli]MBU9168985.1 sugar ABC transporter ATP-binding protein [Burkholderia gladioli]MBU9380197.1 sugar ABC transporter ATP-binding protein [Burkholderia gladioli]MBU9423756.1 sugar ABC transporter ATP-binding protein [Burkholderia gladioli]MDC6127648.1 sugar ABC transporter ATP-binding protein [Burkholderia gladioli]MDN7803841.1 sugar ABC transporter ATP-binding protein [Burkholderia gladioli]
MVSLAQTAFIRTEALGKTFGVVRALDAATLSFHPGECVGVMGHNGAGKSTLMNILAGVFRNDAGTLYVDGQQIGPQWNTHEAMRHGIRCVFQELSLCPNLSLAENMRLRAARSKGLRWRVAAGRQLIETLDRIFPRHGLAPGQLIESLPITKRQMVEIAMAFTPGDYPLRLVILDEPTSSLDEYSATQLLDYLRSFVRGGGICILISHKMHEVMERSDRVVVMREGRLVYESATADTSVERLVAAMGHELGHVERGARASRAAAASGMPRIKARLGERGAALEAFEGEVVGLAGLAGHGQTRLLKLIHALREGRADRQGNRRQARTAFVAGDRQGDGVFGLWSIARNMSLSWLGDCVRGGLISFREEERRVVRWVNTLKVKTPDTSLPIDSLSGGNQQKILFARALGTDASVILMDDPMRGVDIGTKHEVYGIVRAQADEGRTFLWYTTEFEELYHCDRIYVMNEGEIVGEISADELSEAEVLRLSFKAAA